MTYSPEGFSERSEKKPGNLTKAELAEAKKRRAEAKKVVNKYINPRYTNLAIDPEIPKDKDEYFRQRLSDNEWTFRIRGRNPKGSITEHFVIVNMHYDDNKALTGADILGHTKTFEGMNMFIDENEDLKPGVANDQFYLGLRDAMRDFFVLPNTFQWRDVVDNNELTVRGSGTYPDGFSTAVYGTRKMADFFVGYRTD